MKKKFNISDLPTEIPIFPLSNAIFSQNLLPLNIFEPRYKQMTEHAIEGDNLIGMVQSNLKRFRWKARSVFCWVRWLHRIPFLDA